MLVIFTSWRLRRKPSTAAAIQGCSQRTLRTRAMVSSSPAITPARFQRKLLSPPGSPNRKMDRLAIRKQDAARMTQTIRVLRRVWLRQNSAAIGWSSNIGSTSELAFQGDVVDHYLLRRPAAAGQYLVTLDEGQRRRGIDHAADLEFDPAGAAVTTAALVLHIVTGTLQPFGQGFLLPQLEEGVAGEDLHDLELEVAQILDRHLRIDLTDQVGADLHFLGRDLHVVRDQPGIDPGDRVLRGAGEDRLQPHRAHAQVGDVLHVLAEDVVVQADHGTVLEQVLGPTLLLLGGVAEQLHALCTAGLGHLGHLRIVLALLHDIEDVLGA